MPGPESTAPPLTTKAPSGAPAAASAAPTGWAKHRVTVRETRRGTVIALFAWIFAVYDFILFGTLLPGIQADFAWSDATATGIATAISVGTMVVVFAVGPLVDRMGRRKGMIMTVTGTAVASAATAGTFNAASLVAVRSLGGLGLAEQSVNTTYLNEIYALSDDKVITRRKGFIYSVVQGGWPLGTLLAAAFAAALLPVIGWRGCFLVAVFPAIVIVLLRRGLKETPQFQVHSQLKALQKVGDVAGARAMAAEYGIDTARSTPMKQIFRGRSLRTTVVLSLAWVFNWFGIQTFSVLGTSVLTNGKGVDFAGALVMFIVINVVAFTGYLFHGWAGDRFGRRNVIAFGWFASAIVFAAMLLLAQSDLTIVVLYSLGMFFLVGPYSAMLFLMGEAYEADCRATGASFINACSQPGAIVGGVLVTTMLAAGVAWVDTALYVGAAGILVSAVIMLFCRPVAPLADPLELPETAAVR